MVDKISDREEREKLEEKYADRIIIEPKLSRKLVSFQANKTEPFYNWFSYKEGFSSEMVKMFIRDYSKKEGIILDPFSGSNTTLFSAREEGFSSVGIELMPSGNFILQSRIASERLDVKKLKEELERIRNLDFNKTTVPKYMKHIPITEKAFPKDTEEKLNYFLGYVKTKVKDEEIKQILLFACFSILEKISYTRKDGQYLRWDYRSKKSRTKFNKGKIYSFEEALFEKLNQIISDLEERQTSFIEKKENPKIELIQGSVLETLPSIEKEKFDMIITSPPYCNRYDYTRTYALELVFLGLDNYQIKNMRQSLLSATVENKDKVDFLKKIYETRNEKDSFDLAERVFSSNKALKEVLEILEKYKIEGKLNNPGIYRMVKNYFYEHAFIIMEMARVLKRGGRIYYVNDNVKYAGENIPVDLILSEFATAFGLKVNKILKLGNGKGNSSQQMGKHGREEIRKCVYLWEK